MNGLSAIRNINNSNRPTPASRFQRQYKGTQWAVFDSATGGMGFASNDVNEVDARVEVLNEKHQANNRKLIPTDVLGASEQRDDVSSLLATSAKAAA